MNDDLDKFGGAGTFFCSYSLLLAFVLIMQLFIESVLSGWAFLKRILKFSFSVFDFALLLLPSVSFQC